MSRQARSTIVWAIGSLLILAGCGTTAEEQLLSQFFQAARNLDNSIAARLATVRLNPRTEGSVEAFTVTAVSRGGDMTREVAIETRFRKPDGAVISQPMMVTLQRVEGRWMITSLRPTPASQTSRAASSAPRN